MDFSQTGWAAWPYLHCIEGQTRGDNAASGFDFQTLRRNSAAAISPTTVTRAGGEAIAKGGRTWSRSVAPSSPIPISSCGSTNAPLATAPKEPFYGGGADGYTDWKALEPA